VVLKRPEQGPTLAGVVEHVRTKSLLVLKPPQEVSARIQKMQDRGWTVMYP
jgi:hypothetical protein